MPYSNQLRVTCFMAPVQIEGAIGDKYVYFRERYGSWALYVADREHSLFESDATIAKGECVEGMPILKAQALIDAILDVYFEKEKVDDE